jgi:hypothetical protein
MINAFSPKNQGFFDIGIGPSFIDDVIINSVTTEYSIGPSLQTSVGLTYKNGLGLSLIYGFNFNPVKDQTTLADDTATELLNSSISINFIYKALPSSEVGFFLNGGPAFIINSDQKLRSTVTSEPTSTVITADAAGATTQTVSTTSTDQAGSPYESHDNFSFGYVYGGGFEYRQDHHKSFIFQINYFSTNIYNSTFSTTSAGRITAFSDENMNGYSGNATLRYYF